MRRGSVHTIPSRRAISGPGTDRSITQGDYEKWARKTLYSGEKLRVLELRWIKAKSRFEAGQAVLAKAGSE